MITRIVIPQAFENMEEATIGTWLKSEGDTVQKDDPLCELITEKTTFDLPAEGAGILRRIVSPEKSIVPVGFVIGIIGDPEEELPDVDTENAAVSQNKKQAPDAGTETLSVPSVAVPASTTAASAPPAATSGASGAGSRVRATPAARRAAREREVAIEDVAAAFPGKVLSEEDVAKFVQ
ncbi:MAG: lipoyl domain-containing protein [Abitibacteriaceae bacterium]|nr:lipoyl domain-containing protein [Abditibacteriaceae bacterium]